MERRNPCAPKGAAINRIEAVRMTLRRLHDSIRTAEPYIHRIRFHDKRHPRTMQGPELTAFLHHLATERRVSASTQARCAILFLYNRVLDIDMPHLVGLQHARRPVHLPNVLSRRDVVTLLASGTDIRTIQTPLGLRDVVSPRDR